MSGSQGSLAYGKVDRVFLHNGVVHATVTYSYSPLSPHPDIHTGTVTLPVVNGKVTIHVAGHRFTVDVPHQPGYQRMAGSSNTLPFIYGRVLSIFPRNGQLYADVEHRDQSGRFVTSRNLPVKDGKVTIQVGNKKYAVNVTGNRNYDVLSAAGYAGGRKSMLQLYNEYRAMAGRRR